MDTTDERGNTLAVMVGVLADLRQQLAGVGAMIKEIEARIVYPPELQVLRDREHELYKTIIEMTDVIKDVGGTIYAETNEKHPHPALGVRDMTEFSYDRNVAFEWCLSNLKEALQLKEAAFEKYAKGVADVKPIEFVSIVKKPIVTIASDLSAYLPKKDEENRD